MISDWEAMLLEHLVVGPLQCNCTIVADEVTREAIVVDGGDDAAAVIERLDTLGLRARYLVHTHAHIDHIREVGRLREATGAPALLHPADLPLYKGLATQARWVGTSSPVEIVALDGDLHDGQRLRVGEAALTVLHTPGHTPGSVCFECVADGPPTILAGDTLFAGSIGRWDLGGTSMDDIVSSIRRKLLPYGDGTVVIPGHGPRTTIGAERTGNPYITLGSRGSRVAKRVILAARFAATTCYERLCGVPGSSRSKKTSGSPGSTSTLPDGR
ncbi:MAG: MBL fold metallo-hydrolase [Vulcanimicrobiaceae bacterium]